MGPWLLIWTLLAPSASAGTLKAKSQDALGTTLTFSMDKAPFPVRGARFKDDTVMVFVPAGWVSPKSRQVDMILFFHGHFDNAADVLVQKRLREQLKGSGKSAWIVVPQLTVRARDSSAGKLEKPGGVRDLLNEIILTMRALPRGTFDGGLSSPPLELGTLLVAGHSGGFQGAAFAVSAGGVPVAEVVLFDALYGYAPKFATWAAGDATRRLVNVYRPGPGNQKVVKWTDRLRQSLRSQRVPVEDQKGGRYLKSAFRAIFLTTNAPHGEVPFAGELFAAILADSALTP